MKPTRPFSLRLAVAAAAFVAALAGPVGLHAHDDKHFSAGEPGNPRKPFRVVAVEMLEEYATMKFAPERLEIRRGEQVKFVIANNGKETHEFVLASTQDNLKHAALMRKYPDMEHDDPNGKTVKPGGKAEILWRFTKKGEFEFACLIPGHREAGMLGTIIVK